MNTLAIVGSGAVTAVGFDASSTFAAIRAGVSGARQDNIWDPTAGEYIGVARPRMPQWWEGPDMLAELAAPAVQQCLAALPREVDCGTVPIFVLLSARDRRFRETGLDRLVLSELRRRLGFQLAPQSATSDRGRTGILPALATVSRLFVEGSATHAVIVGADTFLRQRVVDSYIERRRVLTKSNSNGFVPGEGACAVLVARPGRTPGGEIRIAGWGEGHEIGTIESETPLTGDGLTMALREALGRANLAMADTHYWLTDQNAEHYKVKECTIAQIRLERRDEPAKIPYQVWHPIEYVGEIGSAIGPCLLALCLASQLKGYAPGPNALMHVGEDNGERAAFVLRWHPEGT